MKNLFALLFALVVASSGNAQTSREIEAIAFGTGTTVESVTYALKTGQLIVTEVRIDDDGFIVVIEEKSQRMEFTTSGKAEIKVYADIKKSE